MFECVCGLRDFEGQGCILADDMVSGRGREAGSGRGSGNQRPGRQAGSIWPCSYPDRIHCLQRGHGFGWCIGRAGRQAAAVSFQRRGVKWGGRGVVSAALPPALFPCILPLLLCPSAPALSPLPTPQQQQQRQPLLLPQGLGKTLQGITLLWTLLSNGHPLLGGEPVARRHVWKEEGGGDRCSAGAPPLPPVLLITGWLPSGVCTCRCSPLLPASCCQCCGAGRQHPLGPLLCLPVCRPLPCLCPACLSYFNLLGVHLHTHRELIEILTGLPLFPRRVIIVCPTSLVSNWDSECIKWLKGRVRTLPLCESSRDDVISSVEDFLHPRNQYQVAAAAAAAASSPFVV